jgi:hypothetical protein
MVEEDSKNFKPILRELGQTKGIDILSPLSTLLFETPHAEDDIGFSLECPAPSVDSPAATPAETNIDTNDEELRIEVEAALGELDCTNLARRNG